MGTHTVRHPVPESSTEGAKRAAGSECLIVEYSHVDSPCVSGCLGGLSVCERERRPVFVNTALSCSCDWPVGQPAVHWA